MKIKKKQIVFFKKESKKTYLNLKVRCSKNKTKVKLTLSNYLDHHKPPWLLPESAS